MTKHHYRVGADIGGTFTDIVFLGPGGRLHTKKVPSTTDDYGRGILEGVQSVLTANKLSADAIDEILHGTTVASNAILESKGARAGLITTEGFRDVLEIRTLRMPRLYDLHWEKPPPLVPRYLRRTVRERVNNRGVVQVALDEQAAREVVARLLEEQVEVIAVCLLNSYANPQHERSIKRIIEELAPGLPHCISFDVLPEIKEYERTSTTVINAYVMPIVARYLQRLRADLDSGGIAAPLMLMQSNGGMMSAQSAGEKPANIIESGPAGGVIGAQALARKLGLADIITFDMGGTTAKASLIERGEVTRSQEYQVGGGIMMGSRLMTGGGYMLKVPAIDLAEVGAGGGSIIWLDGGGGMQVGPQSAGAQPGPVCYDAGGEAPTVTDANLLLGYLNPQALVGGELQLDAARAGAVFAQQIATPMGLSLERAAYGAHQIAAANMIRAIRAVSTERGRDPRQFALFAFGGNGPLFAAGMARSLGMRRIVVPPSPGLFSSFGLLYADAEHHFSRSLMVVLSRVDPQALAAAWHELETQAHAQLLAEGYPAARINISRAANMHYKGQIFELTTAAPGGAIDAQFCADLQESFGAEHERTYGHRAGPEEPVELVSAIVIARGIPEHPRLPERLQSSSGQGGRAVTPGSRRAYFGADDGWLDSAIMQRADLAQASVGPLIVEEYDATCLVPPRARAQLDDDGNILIELD
jgi:N-methylhydantoinase A